MFRTLDNGTTLKSVDVLCTPSLVFVSSREELHFTSLGILKSDP